MRWLMTFRIALRALARNKLRAFLTMLGIIIGVGAVIAMVAIGEGAKSTIRSQISALGTNVLIILPGSNVQGGVRAGTGNVNTLVDTDARAIARELRSVAYASPVMRRQEQLIAGNLNWGSLAQGVAPEFEQIRDWQIESGRFLHEGDMDSAAKVVVIGQTVARQLFGADDPIDSVIRIRNIPFRIVGVLAGKGQTGQGQDQDDTVMIPYTTMQKRLMRITFVQSIVVRAVSAEKVQEAQEQITLLLRQRHRIAEGREDDFTVRNLSDIAEAAQSTARVMAILLGSVAGISLLVGGIGIMNIMLVSVTERTREIGLRMAVGARTRDILGQFLVEAVTLSLIGGLVGVALGMGSSYAIASFFGWRVLLSAQAVGLAVAFAFAIGVFFGFYPARKAARLNPVEALRFE